DRVRAEDITEIAALSHAKFSDLSQLGGDSPAAVLRRLPVPHWAPCPGESTSAWWPSAPCSRRRSPWHLCCHPLRSQAGRPSTWSLVSAVRADGPSVSRRRIGR